MGSTAMAISMKFNFHRNPSLPISKATIPWSVQNRVFVNGITISMKSSSAHVPQPSPFRMFSFPHEEDFKRLPWPTLAVGSGLEASITDSKANEIILRNVTVVVESRDDEKIQVRVDLTGEQTQKAFDDVLTNLARTAPPVPGFRRTKGGKTPNVPKSFLLQVLGQDRVTKFTIQEIVASTMADYVKKENLKVNKKFNTTQTEEELQSAFSPGSNFGFNATLEIEKSETETTDSSSSETTDSSSSETTVSSSSTDL
ncbi:uncharacterized protein LOC131240137 isoform X2 [Magnolia sinica]|uniref:uncharacterized protein LOC131240137 isoform X2 n=1 Tax=Magnolia sinica TaxID=86752 RepID=UPI0026588103|nr:uncharacterized protein LOC131240137 isoform X2 [Magnolia sinica]